MNLLHWHPAESAEAGEALVARPFGAELEDLAVDFDAALEDAIAALLAACLARPSGSAFALAEVEQWTLAKRRQGLLAVAVATQGAERELVLTCAEEACGEKMELRFALTAFRQDWREEKVALELPEGRRLTLRHPRPADLARLDPEAPEEDQRASLAQALVVGAMPETPDWEAAAEAALSEADWLADLELHGACPECGAEAARPLLLEPYLMQELSRVSIRLMDEIHVLAMAYHWTEPEILALPEGRRRHYLSRVQEAWAA